MEARVESFTQGAPESETGLRCRVCELEEENARLRLLVGEMLVANQRLREELKAVRAN
jgi:hypothetical protein